MSKEDIIGDSYTDHGVAYHKVDYSRGSHDPELIVRTPDDLRSILSPIEKYGICPHGGNLSICKYCNRSLELDGYTESINISLCEHAQSSSNCDICMHGLKVKFCPHGGKSSICGYCDE